jgi:hypothetical protein
MVYYFLCFWALQKVNIPFEPFFHKKGKESFGSFPRIATMKKDCRTFFTKGAASNENENYQIINTRKTATVSRGRRIVT